MKLYCLLFSLLWSKMLDTTGISPSTVWHLMCARSFTISTLIYLRSPCSSFRKMNQRKANSKRDMKPHGNALKNLLLKELQVMKLCLFLRDKRDFIFFSIYLRSKGWLFCFSFSFPFSLFFPSRTGAMAAGITFYSLDRSYNFSSMD